tara:strand:+ start:834 stop:1172 length:339 start_codon:yes stop_codon:yes gene_type:complete
MKEYDYDKLAEYYDITELKAGESYERINDFLDKIFKKNKYEVDIVVLSISAKTSLERATKRSIRKGRKPRTKKEVYQNHEVRVKKLSDGKLVIDTEKFSEKQVVNKIIRALN